MSDSSIKTEIGHLSRISSLKMIYAGALILALSVFLVFRWLGSIDDHKITQTIAAILRQETKTANTYAVAKTISDLEKIGVIACSRLYEHGASDRLFYSSHNRTGCRLGTPIGRILNTLSIEAYAINGVSYKIEAQAHIRWLNLSFELVLYGLVLLATMTLSHQRRLLTQSTSALIEETESQRLIAVRSQQQLRHDIASPLTALKIAVSKSQSLETKNKDLIERALARTEGLINRLQTRSNQEITQFDIISPVSEIVTEKNNVWVDPCRIEFESSPTELFAVGKPEEFKAIISNLLNNAYESSLEKSTLVIQIRVFRTAEAIHISIKDNGRGMTPATLGKLGTYGFTYEKGTSGSGFGIHHAMNQLKAWGGTLDFTSELGRGTTVSLRLRTPLTFGRTIES